MKFAPLLLAFAAAMPFAAHAEVHYYLVDSIATKAGKAELRAEARELENIYADMAKQSGVEAKLVFSTDPDVNAFATEVGKDHEKIVVVQEGLLTLMDNDRDAVAAVLGHELAHHKADHIRAGRKKQEGARALGAILGAVVGAKLGKGSGAIAGAAVGNVGGSLVALKFNRDQEMEADRLSLGWMIAAGYNPDGMLRLQRRLGELEGHSKAAIFSTHPTSAKRYEAAQKLIAKSNPPAELLARPVAPLVGEQALAAATAEIRAIRREHLAEVLRAKEGDMDAAALAPVDNMSLDSYARLESELESAGPKTRAQLLARNHLSETQYRRIETTYLERMVQQPGLARRYDAALFRAAQGRFADYARDLADSYDKAQELTLETPPYPIDTAARLYAEMQRRGVTPKDAAVRAAAEREVLKPLGYSYNDYWIASNWWERKVYIAMLLGDSRPALAYYGAQPRGGTDAEDESDDDDAAAAHVRVGDNVRVGNNVRVGGKPLATDTSGDAHR